MATDDSSPDAARRRINHLVAVFALVGLAWIVVGAGIATTVMPDADVAVTRAAVVWATLFVVVTAATMRQMLLRHALRLMAAEHAELRAADRLRDVARIRTRFLRGVSHELRTPLTNIVGYGHTLRDHLDRLDPAVAGECVDRLVANAERLEQLVLDLLDLERASTAVEPVRREPVRVDWLIRDVVDEVAAPDHRFHVEARPSVAHLDVSRTSRILAELARNAVRHTPGGTTIWITADVRARHVRLIVEDDGPGIDSRVLAHAFEPFAQGSKAADSPSPGLGIGLALLQRQVELQGGNVHASSSPLGGARFAVTLPRRGPLPQIDGTVTSDDVVLSGPPT